MLPIKAVFIAMILYSFDVANPWINLASGTHDVIVETRAIPVLVYILGNLILAAIFYSRPSGCRWRRAVDGVHGSLVTGCSSRA